MTRWHGRCDALNYCWHAYYRDDRVRGVVHILAQDRDKGDLSNRFSAKSIGSLYWVVLQQTCLLCIGPLQQIKKQNDLLNHPWLFIIVALSAAV